MCPTHQSRQQARTRSTVPSAWVTEISKGRCSRPFDGTRSMPCRVTAVTTRRNGYAARWRAGSQAAEDNHQSIAARWIAVRIRHDPTGLLQQPRGRAVHIEAPWRKERHMAPLPHCGRGTSTRLRRPQTETGALGRWAVAARPTGPAPITVHRHCLVVPEISN